MRIGQLSVRAGVSVRSLRYYEEHKLLDSTRTSGGHREYSEEALERVLLIQELYAAGLSSKTIVELLPCVATGSATPDMIDQLIIERDRIVERIQNLSNARTKLEQVIAEVVAAYPVDETALQTRTPPSL